jgi:tetraacyldisaccharide 4'-kinase
MKTPGFWFRPPGLASALLYPAGCIFAQMGQMRRRMGQAVKTAVPLIVVGNVVAGGAGKTPVVISLARQLQSRGLKVHLIAKGYGGSLAGPVQVDLSRHTFRDVGDEPLLLATVAPTWIGKDRGAACLAAAKDADVVISDDGLQSPRLAPTLSLLVMDGVLGTGNGRIIPAGPLREPLAGALERVQAVLQMGGTVREWGNKPVVAADFVPRNIGWMPGARIIAFAGIGQPEKFFATCSTSGAELVATIPFPDHHPFSEAEMADLIRRADREEAILVTTAKDAVRVAPHQRAQLRVIEGELRWRNPAVLEALLAAHVPGYKAA